MPSEAKTVSSYSGASGYVGFLDRLSSAIEARRARYRIQNGQVLKEGVMFDQEIARIKG